MKIIAINGSPRKNGNTATLLKRGGVSNPSHTMNANCTCTHTTCEMHGSCKACTDFHRGKPYCKASGFRKALYRLSFWVYDRRQSRLERKTRKTAT